MESTPAPESSGPKSFATVKPKLTFFDLPQETQREIFLHCSQSDLICLNLVCKHFRELASAQLYKYFHIVFPDEDDPSFDSPIDGLAGGLDTFVTSEYDYSKHLRDMSLDTLSTGNKAVAAYKPYLYNVSCGKFMNTLLLLTLRKATSLETFKWNIRVELSRGVYKAMHQIPSLNNLHIRMQAGPSLYETPPPLPYPANNTLGFAPTNQWNEAPPPPPQPLAPQQYMGSPFLLYGPPNPVAPPPPPPPVKPAKKTARKAPTGNEPPTFSGFKNLTSLAVLDVDSLDVIPEIQVCVRNSAATLTKLKLSFSDALAAKARKPAAPDLEPDDTEPEDEFQVPGAHNSNHDDGSGPAKAFRAQEEKKQQEAVLGRIFDVELAKKSAKKREQKVPKAETLVDQMQQIHELAQSIANKIAQELSLTRGPISEKHKAGMVEAITSQLLQKFSEKDASTVESPPVVSNSSSAAGPSSTGTAGAQGSDQSAANNGGPSSDGLPGTVAALQSLQLKEYGIDIASEDLDEADDLLIDYTAQTPLDQELDAPLNVVSAGKTVPTMHVEKTLAAKKANFEELEAKLKDLEKQASELAAVESQPDEDTPAPTDITPTPVEESAQVTEGGLETSATSEQQVQQFINAMDAQADKLANEKERMAEYIRSTRGLPLKSLSIHLIPVKASILSRAVDLRTLKRLTLLNVGPQAPIWTLLSKENKVQPLVLQKIYTDNVSIPFLTCVAQLAEVKELFMLERSPKEKPESFAPATTVTLDQIRKIALKTQLPNLKRLMIKNDHTGAWDIDDKTMSLVCRKGKRLEELAVSMGIKSMHTFMQQISGLVALRALRVIHFRNDDTCMWVMRETRRFIVDNLSHHPELKLEWISVDDDTAERVIRPSDIPAEMRTKRARNRAKGKAKAKAIKTGGIFSAPTSTAQMQMFAMLGLAAPGNNGSVGGPANTVVGGGGGGGGAGAGMPTATVPIAHDPWDTDSSSDEEEESDGTDLKLETIEGVQFYDVWGVRIFEKEIIAGRL